MGALVCGVGSVLWNACSFAITIRKVREQNAVFVLEHKSFESFLNTCNRLVKVNEYFRIYKWYQCIQHTQRSDQFDANECTTLEKPVINL